MARLRLGALLVGLNVGLLILAVAGVGLFASRLIHRFADQEALARVSHVGLAALQAIRDIDDDAFAAAQTLADRAGLDRLVAARDTQGLRSFLEQAGVGGKFSAAAVVADGQVVGVAGQRLPWTDLAAAMSPREGRFLEKLGGNGPLVMGAGAALASRPGAVVLVAVVLDRDLARRVSAGKRVPVKIVDRSAALSAASDPHGPLRARALSGEEPVSARVKALGAYVSDVPLRLPSAPVAGLIETVLPGDEVDDTVRGLIHRLAIWTLGFAIVAAFAGLILGRSLSGPLLSLASSAERIGMGDLDTPIPRPSGAEVGTLAAALEEMRRRLQQLTEDLRRERAESRAIVAGIAEGIFTVDRARTIRFMNPQAAALLGRSAEDAIGRFCGDVLDPRDADGRRPCEDQCPIVHARFRGTARAVEQVLMPDGSRRTIVVTSAPTAEGIQSQVVRDETEAEAVRRLRDAVLANVSHEFKTPLAAQLASIELLLDQLPDLTVPQVEELVRALQRGTLRLTQLIDNLLESVRIESGQIHFRRKAVEIDAVVEDALEMTRPLLVQRNQEAQVDLPWPMPAVTGDAVRLTQVLVNLLANANKFAPEGSIIRIGGASDDATVSFWVADEGPGLPPEAGTTLFGPFVRSMSGEDPEEHGVGLGLWIVKSIIERHHGTIAAENGERGTVMRVTLPRADHPGDGRGR